MDFLLEKEFNEALKNLIPRFFKDCVSFNNQCWQPNPEFWLSRQNDVSIFSIFFHRMTTACSLNDLPYISKYLSESKIKRFSNKNKKE